MKKLAAIFVILNLGVLSGLAQQPPASPAPVTVPSPFGPLGVNPAAAVPPAVVASPAPVPVVVPVPAPAPQTGDDSPVQLNFDNSDIYRVIQIVAGVLNMNYVIDPGVHGTVNVNTNSTLKRSDLLPLLETILKINGATLVKNGNIYEVVLVSGVTHQALQVQQDRGATTSTDDQMVMQIVRMKFIAATEMGNLLTPFLSDGANLLVHNGGNILLLTERKSNLRKLMEIVDDFDTNVFADERVRLYPLKNSMAKDLAPDLTTVFAGYGLSQSASAVRFVALERINSILAISPNPTVFPEVERWLKSFDQGGISNSSQTHYYKVKNAKAADLQLVLSQLFGGNFQVSSIYSQVSTNPSAAAGATPQPVSPPPAGGNAASAGGSPSIPVTGTVRGDIRIVAVPLDNALIIQASPQVYPEIERMIGQLDNLPRQVLIDAKIYEVTLDHSMSLGLSAALQNKGITSSATSVGFGGSGGPPALSAQTVFSVGSSRELFAFLNASENRSRVRTLSAPSVMVSDNKTANFQVGSEIPVPTSSSVTPVQSGGTNLFAQTITFRPTGVLLTVTPQINDNGNVTLDISQEVSAASTNTTSGVVAPVIGKSSVNSSIVVQDGQTIVLGGFIRENMDSAHSRLPLIGEIPGVGVLFGNTTRSAGRTELVVLITPHVIRTHEEADRATEELKGKLKEIQKVLK